jgi:hypothetical protein
MMHLFEHAQPQKGGKELVLERSEGMKRKERNQTFLFQLFLLIKLFFLKEKFGV